MKTNILRKPVHPHAAYSLILATLVAFFFTVSLRNSFAQEPQNGFCFVKDEKYSIDILFDSPDEGEGYVKTGIGEVTTYEDLEQACTPDVFEELAEKLCAKNPGAKYYERFESFYSSNNKEASYGWNGTGDAINCPTTKFELPASQATIDSSKVEKINTIKVIEDEDNYGAPAAGYEEEVKAKNQILLQSATPEDDVLNDFTMYKNPFPDTDLTTLVGMAAAELYRRAVLGGFPDGTFKADRSVNRAEAAKFLLLVKGETVEDVKNDKKFPDVLDGQWYTKYVVTAADLGIINGYPDGTFRPGNTVNTAEFLKMLANTFGLEENGNYYYDDVHSSDWFSPYAGIAAYFKLFPNRVNELKPGAPLTRGDVAVAMYQYLANRNQENQ